MFFSQVKKGTRGFSLIEALVVIGLTVMIFAGLFAAFEYSLKLIAHSRAKMTALSLATDRVEYLRSLPYADVGTVFGIPNGAIPQNRVVSLNGIDFAERVLIEYVDDPADGSGALDSNSVVADYKKMKVEYTWNIYGSTQSFSLISSIVPRAIETTSGGGTVRVNVFDADVLPLPGVSVRLLNTTGTSTIDVTRNTDATGAALFTGAPANSNYQIFVSAPGYSSDQTREATTTLAVPSTAPVSLLESDVTTVSFQIDRLSDLLVNVYSSQVTDSHTEPFNDLLGADSSSYVVATGSALALTEVAGVYDAAGTVLLNPISPATIEAWGVLEVDSVVPTSTEVRVRFYSSTSTASLISESNLPGNLAGFATRFVDLSNLSLSTYPSLVVGVDLSTTDTSVTPQINSLILSHVESRNMLPSTNFTMRGSKIIGATSGAVSIYKFDIATTTDLSGQLVLDDIEWDSYQFELGSGLVISEACSSNPYFLAPDTEKTLNLLAAPASTDNLRVEVKDSTGAPIIDATVELRQVPSSTWSDQTSWCGQVYFGGLTSASDYELEVSATGYTTQILSSATISGTTVQSIVLAP
jgi:hypothetical protein